MARQPALPMGQERPGPLRAAGVTGDHAGQKGGDKVALGPRHLFIQNKLGEAETKSTARAGDSGSCLH